MCQVKRLGVVSHQRAAFCRWLIRPVEKRHAHGTHFKRCMARCRVGASGDGQVPAADASGLFDECDLGEAAAIKLSGGSQACHAGANDADSMVGVSCLGDAVFLLDQGPVVEAQIGWVWKAGRPFAFGRAFCSPGFPGND
ncbi:hypothetical protein D3C85_1249230 [compost metagenome]